MAKKRKCIEVMLRYMATMAAMAFCYRFGGAEPEKLDDGPEKEKAIRMATQIRVSIISPHS